MTRQQVHYQDGLSATGAGLDSTAIDHRQTDASVRVRKTSANAESISAFVLAVSNIGGRRINMIGCRRWRPI
jgi:hypothetical protein